LLADDSEVLVGDDRAVLLNVEGRLEGGGGGDDTGTDDDNVGRDELARLELETAAGGTAVRRLKRVDNSVHLELDALLLVQLLHGRANLLAQDALKRHLFHSNDYDRLGRLDKGGRGLHRDKAGADGDDARLGVGGDGGLELGGVVKAAEHDHVVHRGRVGPKVARVGTGGDEQLVIVQLLAAAERDVLRGSVEVRGRRAQLDLDRRLVKVLGAAQQQLVHLKLGRLGQLDAVDRQHALLGHEHNLALEAVFAQRLRGSVASGASTLKLFLLFSNNIIGGPTYEDDKRALVPGTSCLLDGWCTSTCSTCA